MTVDGDAGGAGGNTIAFGRTVKGGGAGSGGHILFRFQTTPGSKGASYKGGAAGGTKGTDLLKYWLRYQEASARRFQRHNGTPV